MSTDPRVEVAAKAFFEDINECPASEWPILFIDYQQAMPTALKAADAADREAGVHRVRVGDATVERVARVMWRSQGYPDSMITGRSLERFEDAARAVLHELTGAGS